MKYALKCTTSDWYCLISAVDKAREGSDSVKVPKAALDRLLKDHSQLVNLNKDVLTGDL